MQGFLVLFIILDGCLVEPSIVPKEDTCVEEEESQSKHKQLGVDVNQCQEEPKDQAKGRQNAGKW